MNYTEIVCMGIKTKDHSDFMNELNLRMILWSTAEAVLRQKRILKIKHNCDSMVYCGSGTETKFTIFLILKFDPMVYCGSGTETFIISKKFG